MPGMLSAMVKEEWRVHASVFGGRMFLLFPFLIAAFTFGFSLFIPMFLEIVSIRDIYLLIALISMLFGLSAGAFALVGREVMNRRFGYASMVAFSSRTLPVSERRIFANLVANDVLFYALLYVLPFFAGFSGAAAVTGSVPVFSPLLLSSVVLCFLFGLSISFFLSTLYVRLGKAFVVGAVIAAGGLAAGGFVLDMDIASSFPPVAFMFLPGPVMLAWSAVLIAVPFAFSMAFMRIEFPSGVKSVRSRVAPLSESLGRLFSNPHFVAKDMLDLQRSEGGIGKVFFSFLIPLAMIWAMLFIFSGSFSLSPDSLFLVFCVLVGALSSTMYNWLTEFDGFSSYSFLPVRVSDVIKGKLRGYALLNLFSAAAVAAFALWNGNAAALPLGLAAFVSVSVYTLSFTVYLGGLRPNVLIYSARTFLAYVGAAAPAMIVSIVASIGYPPALAAIALVMLPASFFVTRRSFSRWDSPAMSDRDF